MMEAEVNDQFWVSPGDITQLSELCPRLTLKELVVVAKLIFGVKIRVVFSSEEFGEHSVAVELNKIVEAEEEPANV